MIDHYPASVFHIEDMGGGGHRHDDGRRVAAQDVVMQRNLSLAMAKTLAEAAMAACKSKGYNTSAAVVDRAGQVLVITRDEQATAQTADMARRKTYIARMLDGAIGVVAVSVVSNAQ